MAIVLCDPNSPTLGMKPRRLSANAQPRYLKGLKAFMRAEAPSDPLAGQEVDLPFGMGTAHYLVKRSAPTLVLVWLDIGDRLRAHSAAEQMLDVQMVRTVVERRAAIRRAFARQKDSPASAPLPRQALRSQLLKALGRLAALDADRLQSMERAGSYSASQLRAQRRRVSEAGSLKSSLPETL